MITKMIIKEILIKVITKMITKMITKEMIIKKEIDLLKKRKRFGLDLKLFIADILVLQKVVQKEMNVLSFMKKKMKLPLLNKNKIFL